MGTATNQPASPNTWEWERRTNWSLFRENFDKLLVGFIHVKVSSFVPRIEWMLLLLLPPFGCLCACIGTVVVVGCDDDDDGGEGGTIGCCQTGTQYRNDVLDGRIHKSSLTLCYGSNHITNKKFAPGGAAYVFYRMRSDFSCFVDLFDSCL